MRLGSVVSGGATLLVLVAAACSSEDSGGGPTCGSGTVLKGDECVVAGGSGAGGNAMGGKATGGTAPTAGTQPVSEAGTGNRAGSRNDGGAVNGGRGNGDDAGAPGEAGAGGDAPIDMPAVVPTRWLVFSHEKGIFAYDINKFPETEGLLTLSAKTQGPNYLGLLWSPDGRTLLYRDQGIVYAVDMASETPGAARLLLSNPASPNGALYMFPAWAWSADSKSMAIVTQKTLSVFDPGQAAPTLHPLTTSMKSYQWAPAGDELLYADDTGTFVVQVTNGTPGTPLAVDASASIWSPTGKALAGVKNGDLALTTLAANGATLDLVTDLGGNDPPVDGGAGGAGGAPPVIPTPENTLYNIKFNKDGSKLLVVGELDDNGLQAYLVDLKPTRGEPTLVVSGAPAGATTSCDSWSPDGSRLFCNWWKDTTGSYFAADPAGGAPIIMVDVYASNDLHWSPNPARHQLLGTNPSNEPGLILIDLAKPKTAVPLTATTPYPYSVDPAGKLITYFTKPTLHLVNVDAPSNPTVDIPTNQSAFDPPVWRWSPNSEFLAFADGVHQQRLVRMDGTAASTPVPLQGTSTSTIYFDWQP